MASKIKYLFVVIEVMAIQVALVTVYLATGDVFIRNTSRRRVINESYATSREDVNVPASGSTFINTILRETGDVNVPASGSTFINTTLRETGDVKVPASGSTFINTISRETSTANKTIEKSPPREPETFQSIDGKQAWLYSAFYDHVAANDGRPLVRVFGIAFKNVSSEIYCNFKSNGTSLTSASKIKKFPDWHNRPGRPSYVECPLPSNERPTHVSVSFQKTDKPTNRLQILYPGPRIRNFTVCYSVLHRKYNKAAELIESIEINRILGAEHFMVYNYSISPEVSQILSRYQEDGLVTVLQWPIPTHSSWYFAQMTALNDCFYRNRNTSRFVVVVDTDELILPTSLHTWMELIRNVSDQESDVSEFMNSPEPSRNVHNLTGCFMVRSSQFFRNMPTNWDSLPSPLTFTEEERKNIIKYRILSLSQFWREDLIFPHEDRSKYIARPELVYNCGIHFVHSFTSPNSCLRINETVALVQHYRVSENITGVNSNNVLKFKKTLYPRIMEQIKRFPEIFH